MLNRLHCVSWIVCSFIIGLFILFGSGAGIAHAAPVQRSTSADQPSGAFAPFAGTWIAHGAFLSISPDGNAKFEARTYTWCTPHGAQPCDSMDKNTILYGYHEQLALSSVEDSIAHGALVASNNSLERPDTPITLTLGANDTLIYASGASVTILCGPAAPAGTCGA